MVFGPEPAVPVLEAVADVNGDSARSLAEAFGFKRWTTNWRELLSDPASMSWT
jgi:predicted dehydrogenase